MDLEKDLQNAREEYGITNSGSPDWFKFKEGSNKLRLLTAGDVIAEHFKKGVCYGVMKGCPHHVADENGNLPQSASVKWMLYIHDLSDDSLKLAKFPLKIMKALKELKADTDWGFADFPMPYSIDVKATNASTKEVEYAVIPNPNKVAVPEEIKEELEKQTAPSEIIQKMKDKQEKNDELNGLKAMTPDQQEVDTIEYPDDGDDPDKIAFQEAQN